MFAFILMALGMVAFLVLGVVLYNDLSNQIHTLEEADKSPHVLEERVSRLERRIER